MTFSEVVRPTIGSVLVATGHESRLIHLIDAGRQRLEGTNILRRRRGKCNGHPTGERHKWLS